MSKRAQAIECVLAAAKAMAQVQEHGGDNMGEMVELFLKLVGLKGGQPWCASYVSYVGHFALLDEHDQTKSEWPVVMSGGCAVLGEWAERHKVLKTEPQRGDLFLLYFPTLKRFAHVGFVLDPTPDANGAILVIEGNTSKDGSREGFVVAIRRRKINTSGGSRFVRWAEVLPD